MSNNPKSLVKDFQLWLRFCQTVDTPVQKTTKKRNLKYDKRYSDSKNSDSKNIQVENNDFCGNSSGGKVFITRQDFADLLDGVAGKSSKIARVDYQDLADRSNATRAGLRNGSVDGDVEKASDMSYVAKSSHQSLHQSSHQSSYQGEGKRSWHSISSEELPSGHSAAGKRPGADFPRIKLAGEITGDTKGATKAEKRVIKLAAGGGEEIKAAGEAVCIVKNSLNNPKIEKNIYKMLLKHQIKIQRRIDLHGMTRKIAFERLSNFIYRCYEDEVRYILLITGKGKDDQGILKRDVPQWLVHGPISQYVNAFEEAGLHHGGGGAIYVRIRKKN